MTTVHTVKSMEKISQSFVAFSEYTMNFNLLGSCLDFQTILLVSFQICLRKMCLVTSDTNFLIHTARTRQPSLNPRVGFSKKLVPCQAMKNYQQNSLITMCGVCTVRMAEHGKVRRIYIIHNWFFFYFNYVIQQFLTFCG